MIDERESSGQRVLITGATGFIGRHLAARLVKEGYYVRCLARASSDISSLADFGVELARGDLTEATSLAPAVRGCRYVFHCAALVSDWATIEEIKRINVGGTRNVLEASVGASVERFVHLSTTDVYGYPDTGEVDESHTPTRFGNWYAQSKREAEAEVRRFERSNGLTGVILRPATVYGPGSREVIGEIARAICSRRMFFVNGGRAIAGLCFVENLIDAALLALRHGAGQTFNITDGLSITWRQFIDDLADGLRCPRVRWSIPYSIAHGIGFGLEKLYRMLRRTTGVHTAPLLSRQAVDVLGRNQAFSNRRARELLGWESRVDYRDGLEATVGWLQTR